MEGALLGGQENPPMDKTPFITDVTELRRRARQHIEKRGPSPRGTAPTATSS